MSAAPVYKVAAVVAATIVWKAQHDGSHEQDRWDAMAWLETFKMTGYERCPCAKCLRLWAREDLACTGTLAGISLGASRARGES